MMPGWERWFPFRGAPDVPGRMGRFRGLKSWKETLMADYKRIKVSGASDERVIWTAQVKLGESNTLYTLYVLTANTFYFAKYDDPAQQAEALEEAQQAEDLSETLGSKALVV